MGLRRGRPDAQPRATGPALSTAVVGLFDEAAAAQIEALRQCVAGDDAVPPHLTFGVYDDVAPEALAARLDALPPQRPIRLRFPALGAFPMGGVLHLSPAASLELAALHADLQRVLEAVSRPHFQPGEWVPHCTLASGLDPAALGAATAMLAASFATIEATLSTLAVIEFPPPRVHRRLALGGSR